MRIYTKEMIKKQKNKTNSIKQKIKYVYTPIVIFFIIFCICVAFQKIILRKDNIDFLGYRTYIVLTGSMEPEIMPNDMIIVRSCSQDSIKVGSIINFFPEGKTATVTHRVIEILEKDGETLYRTKGDNNNSADTDPVKYEQIQGTVAFKISKIGALLTNLLTGTGITVIFLGLVLCYNYSSKKDDRRLVREEARKRYNFCKYGKDKEDVNDAM